METVRDDEREFAFLRVQLPPEPQRRPRGGLPTVTARLANCGLVVALAIASIVVLTTDSTWGPPLRVFAVLALASAVVGAITFPGCLRDAWRARETAARRAAHPDEPWLSDHDWDPSGTSRTPLARIFRKRDGRRGNPWFGLVMAGNGATQLAAQGIWWPTALIVGTILLFWSWLAWKAHGFGTARVSYAKFPFAPGERVTLYFGTSEGGASFERVAFHLRRIREAAGGPLGSFRAALQTKQQTEVRPPGLLPGPDSDVEISFDVPANAGGTCLSSHSPEYWVLDVVAATSAGPYTESFLVPIYERPRSPAATSAA